MSSPKALNEKSEGSPETLNWKVMVGEVVAFTSGQRIPLVMFVPEVFMAWETAMFAVTPLNAVPAASTADTVTVSPVEPVRAKVKRMLSVLCAETHKKRLLQTTNRNRRSRFFIRIGFRNLRTKGIEHKKNTMTQNNDTRPVYNAPCKCKTFPNITTSFSFKKRPLRNPQKLRVPESAKSAKSASAKKTR